MNGIYGVVELGGAHFSPSLVEARGAAGDRPVSHFVPGSVCGIAPLSPGKTKRQQQPFRHGDLSLILDGEICQEGSQSPMSRDAKMLQLLRLYEKEGTDFLTRLRGSFSLALWNAKSRSFLLATDPFGTRPLYYCVERGVLAFAPRVSCFSRFAQITRRIDPNALYFYLNHSYVPAPHTIYRDIRRLQPGQVLLAENGQLSVKQYWDMSYPEEQGMSKETAAGLVREAVEDSVRVRLADALSDGPPASFLSGGTDSTVLVGLLTKITGMRVKTFSVGFDEGRYNELEYARIAAKYFQCQAHERFVRAREALEVIPLLAEEFDEPFGNSSAIPTYFCLRMAREAGVETMFAGDGGDEIFAGNERYLTEKILSLYPALPAWMRKCVDPLAYRLPPVPPLTKVRNYIRRSNQPNPERVLSYQLYVRDHAGEFFTDDFRDLLEIDFPLRIAQEHYGKVGGASLANRLLYLDLKLAIGDNDLFKVNRMAESLGIKIRYPYLDHRLASISGRIPAALKIKGLTKRYIFKEAFRDLLPRPILRKKKHGFGLPTGDWLRTDAGFRELARSLLLDPRSMQRGYFQRGALEGLLRAHDEEKSGYYGSMIWNFMMLELWHRMHVDS